MTLTREETKVVLDILDKVCVAYLAFFIYRQLPKRMVHFFSGDK